MRNKIAGKLILSFTCALLLFSIVVGGAFTALFTRHTVELRRQEMEKQAQGIAQTFASFLSDEAATGSFGGHGMGMHGNGGRGAGFGMYLQFLEQNAVSDVWLMDAQSRLIARGYGNAAVESAALPADAEALIDLALGGQTAFSEGFSEVLGTKSITAGVPVIGENGAAVGVVLLHAPVTGISLAVADGLRMLGVSMLAALLLASAAAVLLSLRFTQPLRRMKDAAVLLARGDYSAKSGVVRRDEIGELAGVMDGLSDRLAFAAAESERLEQMRRDFVSNISHELRTPVTVLRGSLEALCDGIVSDEAQVKEYHRQMLSESVHLQRLVNDLLELSRLQNTDFAFEMAAVDLRALAEDIVRGMRRVAGQKRVELSLLCEPAGSDKLSVHGDYSRLRQMLLVVVDNAVKFSPAGRPVALSIREAGARWSLSVSNEGPGIPPGELPYIFDRFYKSRSEENKNGTGLGLAIAKQIADRHDIQLVVESLPGKTTFIFYFSRR